MHKQIDLKLTTKLLLAFILFTLFTTAVQVVTTYFMNERAAIRNMTENLSAVNVLKRKNIEDYFRFRRENLSVLVSSASLENAFIDLNEYNSTKFDAKTLSFDIKSDDYIRAYNRHINYFTKFVNSYGFVDMFLLTEEEGTLLFSVNKKQELGQSMNSGPHKNSALASVWRIVSKSRDVAIHDFSGYSSDLVKPYMLIGSPVFKGSELLGIVVLQISEKDIDNIVRERSGLGSTGESFAAGLNPERIPELRSNTILQKGVIGEQVSGRHIDAVLRRGEAGTDIVTFKDGIDYLVSYERINIKGLRWAIVSSIQEKEVLGGVQGIARYSSLMSIALMLIVLLIGMNLSAQITKPILQIKDNLLLLSHGILPKNKIDVKARNEIGEIQSAFNSVVDGIRGYVEFADKIGKNQLDASFEKLSDSDVLGTSLLAMQKNLKEADTAAKQRHKEEEKQRWMTEGVARFSEILRQNFDSLDKHAENIILNLTNFLKANQGGLFIYNDENKNDPSIDLLACFAFERIKHLNKTIRPGEGLIGACFMEKETIYLTNIPEDFPNIVSGLGGALPKSVLIVPLKVENRILGIIELISFAEMQSHEIEFVEKIAESIGSSILSSQINDRTARLLEESKLRSEQMAAQEEEMRQNMEELQATQEESMRKEMENNNIIHALNNCTYIANFSLDGCFIEANERFLSLLGKKYSEITGQHYGKFNPSAKDSDFFEQIISAGGASLNSLIIGKTGTITLSENYTVFYDNYEEPQRILLIAYESITA
jgi:methyl-accepting chemotaxis protein